MVKFDVLVRDFEENLQFAGIPIVCLLYLSVFLPYLFYIRVESYVN